MERVLHAVSLAWLGFALSGCNGSNESRETAAPVSASEVPTQNSFEGWSAERRLKVAASAQVFCGNCHVAPKASSFSSEHWSREVQRGFDFYFASGRADLVVPKAADIAHYYRHLAPKELSLPHSPPLDVPACSRFESLKLPTSKTEQAVAIAGLSVVDLGNDTGASLVMTDMRSGAIWATKLTELHKGGATIQLAQLQNPCRVHACQLDDDGKVGLLVSDLGSFLPADHQAGRVVWLRPSRKNDTSASIYEPEVLLSGCGRVADAQAHDLDADGDLDLIVSDFGWHETGQLQWLERVAPGQVRADAFVRHLIDDRPGALESEVLDLNGDGHLDIVALIAQEFEVVMCYLGDGQGKFEPETIFSADDPAFGSSGMHWCDMDHDGDQDCLLTNGDSFDSFEVKPYHSIQWLENTGNLKFVAHEVMRLPGVHEAIAGDLDGDGDLDIVAAAFLPRDLRSGLSGEPVGIVWLENDGQQNFKVRPLQVGKCSYPAICAADFSGDGKLDIAAANFYEDTAQLKSPVELLIQK